jgi:hypothetical protein
MNLSHLPELFPDADFGFSMRMRPGNPRSFFASSAGHEAIIAERVCCLSAAPQRCLLVTPEASGLGDPLAAFASQTLPAFQSSCVDPDQLPACLLQLGRAWEPDFLLLSPDTTRRNVLRAGCVCFPSNWAPEEKIGLGLESIQSAVPGLNNTIGTKIHQFLGRLRPGAGWFRSNWGISSSPELNQHPARKLNRRHRTCEPRRWNAWKLVSS